MKCRKISIFVIEGARRHQLREQPGLNNNIHCHHAHTAAGWSCTFKGFLNGGAGSAAAAPVYSHFEKSMARSAASVTKHMERRSNMHSRFEYKCFRGCARINDMMSYDVMRCAPMRCQEFKRLQQMQSNRVSIKASAQSSSFILARDAYACRVQSLRRPDAAEKGNNVALIAVHGAFEGSCAKAAS